MKQNIFSFTNAQFNIAAAFIATTFKSWIMKLKSLFDFSRKEEFVNLAEAKSSLCISSPLSKDCGYNNSPLKRACPDLSGGLGGFAFVMLILCLTNAAMVQEYNTDANTVLLSL